MLALSFRSSAFPRPHHGLVALALVVTTAGCGSGDSDSGLIDPLHLIENFDAQPLRHHPTKLVEIELGTFSIRRPSQDMNEIVSVDFTVSAVVPVGRQSQITAVLKERKALVADEINSVVKSASFEDLNQIEMHWLKGELKPMMNKLLRTEEVRDIVFADYSVNVD